MDFAESQRRPGKHPVGLIIVIVLHLLLGWALLSGLARKVVEVVKAPIETKIIEEVKPPPPPPPENLPPPPKNLPPPPAFVPPPEVQVAQPPAPTITTTNVQPPPQEVKISQAPPAVQAPPAPAAPRGARPAIADIAACAPKGSDYPVAAARAQATGTTRVRFTVDAEGKLAKAEIVKSAGPSREHRMLDRVAVDKLSECKFRPGFDENGHPTGGTFEAEYVWTLQ
ncbi:energy transducer TonB [Ideonella dechloratans]|uniref:energy transducer TonB n=1 Tax=Ideonella dechloratans TaxID=36863 RepID=UPI0035B14890